MRNTWLLVLGLSLLGSPAWAEDGLGDDLPDTGSMMQALPRAQKAIEQAGKGPQAAVLQRLLKLAISAKAQGPKALSQDDWAFVRGYLSQAQKGGEGAKNPAYAALLQQLERSLSLHGQQKSSSPEEEELQKLLE